MHGYKGRPFILSSIVLFLPSDVLSVAIPNMLSPPSSDAPVFSPAQTLVDGKIPQRHSATKRYVLLVIFCLAQFLDAFNNSALFSAIPSLVRDLHMTDNEAIWILSAFQLTFSSFLLIVSHLAHLHLRKMLTTPQSGKISDVYNPSTCL